MNKSIIMSIQPEWLAKILNGEKTIEIRKTMPKCELPIDVYLYCTKGKPIARYEAAVQLNDVSIGSDYIYETTTENDKSAKYFVNGKVVAKFTLNHVSTCLNTDYGNEEILKNACLTKQELDDYVGKRKFFAWHIDNLVIFDKPKELSEFYKQNSPENHLQYINWYKDNNQLENYYRFVLNKAPQSWQYVYVKGEKNEI